MRPSKKRASSAGQESDNEPDSAWPDEWEKQCLVVQSNREGEVRGIGEGKDVQGTRQKAPLASLQPSRKKNREALSLTKRLKAKAIRESPRVRKLRDKLAGRVVAGGGGGRRKPSIGISRAGASLDETTGPWMPYSGDNVSFAVSRECDCLKSDELTFNYAPAFFYD